MQGRQNEYCSFLRKPSGCASTWGKEACFLDCFVGASCDNETGLEVFAEDMRIAFGDMIAYCGLLAADVSSIIAEQKKLFSKEEEYGLLNRLDTDTSGLLYFARSREVYEQYHGWQQQGLIQKYYLARVWGDPRRNIQKMFLGDDSMIESLSENSFLLRFPIMHHRHDTTRMVSTATHAGLGKLKHQGRGKMFYPETSIEVIEYNQQANESLCRVMIHQGVRHQIRIHFATLGTPIIGDILYNHEKSTSCLQLISAGCMIKNPL